MLGKTNAGGMALNFKIDAYATKNLLLADSPKRNTIGVVTRNDITSYIFSPSEPAVPTTGMVWIATGSSSPGTFNAIKKNVVQVSPLYAKQYIGGKWAEVEAMSYIDGVWLDWFKYLYNKGDECVELTGGWKAYPYKTSGSGSTASTPSVTKGSSTIRLSLGDLKAGALFTEKPIDLTDISSLSINVIGVSDSKDTGFLLITKSKGNNYTRDAGVKITDTGLVTLDVSDYKGQYYVAVNLQGSGKKYIEFDRISTRGGTVGVGSHVVLEAKTVTPTKDGFDVKPTPGMALSMVTINPIPNKYQDVSGVTAQAGHVLDGKYFVDNTGALKEGNIPVRSSTDVKANGATVTVPAGYYESAVSKTVDGAGGSDIALEPITVTPTKESQEFTPEDGKAYSLVTVEPIPDQYQDVSGVTAQEGQVLEGSYFVDKTGALKEGEIPVVSDVVEFTNDDIQFERDDSVLGVSARFETGQYVSENARVKLNVSNARFGRATKEDVAKGVTFTSANGVLLVGEHECPEGDVIIEPSDIEVGSLEELHYWTKSGGSYEEVYQTREIMIGTVGGTVQYVDDAGSVAVSGTAITLLNPKEYTLTSNASDAKTALGGKYVKTASAVYKFTTDTVISYYAGNQYMDAHLNASKVYTLTVISAGETQTTIVVSQDSAAYPENGKQDGYTYVYQGTLSDTETAAVIQALAITENGTYTPPAGVDGYSPVTVNVASDLPTIAEDLLGSAEDLAEGKQLIGADGSVVTGSLKECDSTYTVTAGSGSTSITWDDDWKISNTMQEDVILRKDTEVNMFVGSDFFGNAAPGDVRSGKTFTSQDGICVTGTLEADGYQSGDIVKAAAASATLASGYNVSSVSASDSVTKDENGVVSLSGVTSTVAVDSIDNVKGRYVKASSGSIYYVPADATITQGGTTYSKTYTADKANLMFVLA